MAGGEGSRLRPLTSRRPKPLVPVAGTPVVEHILRLLRRHGITEVILTLQYLGADIRNRLGDGGDLDMAIDYVVEDSPLGTAGSVRNAAHLLDGTFLVISGDAMTDIDLTHIIAQHHEKGAAATVVLKSMPNPLEYGVVITEPDGAIRRFLEKPSWGDVFSDHVNTGMYVVEPRVLDYVKPDVAFDWSQDVFPMMLRRHEPLFGVVADGYWCDIGTMQSYLQANWDALEGRVDCEIGGRREGNVWIGEGVEFGLGARIEGPAFIGDEAKIKANAFINGPAVIDRFCVVDDNAKVSNTIVWAGSYIGETCRLRQSVIGRSVTIKNNCVLESGTVIGDDCIIGKATRINSGVKIWPHKEIEPGSTVRESVVWAGEWKRGLFSSYGMGGLVNVELTPEFCARLGAAFGAMLSKGAQVAVTRDQARSSRMIKRAMIAGIVSAGARVLDLSALPVPVTQFATRALGCAAGLHVLVSPLDQRSADIRFFDAEGFPLDKRDERRLENLFFREDFRRASFYEMGDIEYATPLADYMTLVLDSIDVEAIRRAHLRVLVDYDHSAVSLVLPELLSHLDVDVISVHAGFTEHQRPRSAPDEAALITRAIGADVGCVLNASGERLVVVDDDGVVVSSHQAMGVIAELLMSRESGVVLTPATVPHWLARMVEAHRSTSASSKADAASILRAADDRAALFAADGEGGFIWPRHLAAFDATYTVIKLLELRAVSGSTLSSIRTALPQATYLTASEFCPWEAKGMVMRTLIEQHRDVSVDLTDGLKVLLPDGFVLVAPDPDAPAYRIVASLDDPVEAQTLLSDYGHRVRHAQGHQAAEPVQSAVLDLS